MTMGFYSSSLLLTSLALLVLAIFVFLKGRDKLPNVTLGLFSTSLALWCFGQFMGEVVDTKELVLFWTREGIAGAIFIPVFFLHFILSLINRVDKDKTFVYLVYGLGVLFLSLDFTPLFVPGVEPVPGFRYYPRAGVVYPFFTLFILACFGYAFFRLFEALKKSRGAKKNQLLYLILACVIGFLGGITSFFPIWKVNFPVVSHIALPLFVLITVYAILKHRLLDISIIFREGLIYSTLTVLFAGFYVLAVLFANYFLSQFIHFSPVATIFLVVFASVLFFQPVRDRVQKTIDRLFFRGEFRYQKRIDALSADNQRLFRSLLQADKLAALGTISAGMAHEVKNPLASIKGLTQVLEQNLDDPQFIRDYQEIVDRQINRINALVEKLLKFGQPQRLSISSFDINKIIEEVLGLVENQCRKNNIVVDKKLTALPKIEADYDQISQVFINLVLNAIQAMAEGGTLSVRSYAQGTEAVCIEVGDSGMGISADKINKIFDPFFTTREQGTGMGLAVAYRIVKSHNGDISVESEVGKGLPAPKESGVLRTGRQGTRFKVWLPIVLEQSA